MGTKDTYHPEFEKILKDCGCDEYTVQHGIGEEKQEKLVVGKANTVVYPKRKMILMSENKNFIHKFLLKKGNTGGYNLPGTVVVHLQNTP